MGERILKMIFVTETGTKATIRLRGVKESLADIDVSNAMDLIISKNIFLFKGGALVKKDKAFIEQTNTDSIEITA